MGSAAAPHPRNLAASTSAGARRERARLAGLIAVIDPERSEAIAEALLAEHRTLARLFVQSPAALARTLGDGSAIAELLLAARAATLEAMRANLHSREIHPASPKLLEYLRASMGALPDEVLRVLFLSPSRGLLADEQLQHGSLGHVAIYPRTIFRRAIELDAAAIILVHNHPSGDPRPSTADIDATHRLAAIGRSLDIEILEHIIVTVCEHEMILGGRWQADPPTSSGVMLRSEPKSWRQSSDRMRALANANRTHRRRLLRQQLVGAAELFGEPAWDMLLDLFIHEADARPVSTSSACIASGLPMTSALRLLQNLCDAGLVTREPDREDGRRNFIRLAPDLGHRLLAYFAAGDE